MGCFVGIGVVLTGWECLLFLLFWLLFGFKVVCCGLLFWCLFGCYLWCGWCWFERLRCWFSCYIAVTLDLLFIVDSCVFWLTVTLYAGFLLFACFTWGLLLCFGFGVWFLCFMLLLVNCCDFVIGTGLSLNCCYSNWLLLILLLCLVVRCWFVLLCCFGFDWFWCWC